jgi:hypothetical protein
VTEEDPQRTQEMEVLPDAEESAAAGTSAAAAAEAAAQAERTAHVARAEEVRADVAGAGARSAEEDTSEAHADVESAQATEEKLSRKERKAREKAAAAEADAQRARKQAEEAARLARETAAAAPRPSAGLSGAALMQPGIGSTTAPTTAASAYVPPGPMDSAAEEAPGGESALERPEVVAGLAFAGALIFARILKRLVD